MERTYRVVVAGGGVAGLAAAYHLVEIFAAREAAGLADARLDLHFVAQLVPHSGSVGSGLGGKAMSRTFEGRYDEQHGGLDRQLFYGPAMPWRGAIPHGYHVLWGYPNLRRMLREAGEGDDLGGMLRPPAVLRDGKVVIPGGASVIPSFQALLDDPPPGGPGIGLVGLVDPEHPESATLPVTRRLLGLRDSGAAQPFLRAFERLFRGLSGDIDPFSFADLFYAHEVDLELRLSLILGALTCRGLDPERDTVRIDGRDLPLTEVEYDRWTEEMVAGWAREQGVGPGGFRELLLDLLDLGWLLPEWLPGDVEDRIEAALHAWFDARLDQLGALGALVETSWEASPLPDELISLLPDRLEARFRAFLEVYLETERVVRDLPRALLRLGEGSYPVWRTLHSRFALDATFASPRSFDAAQAVRSLQLCFLSPRASRMWTPDGAKIQRLWLRLWQRLRTLANGTSLVTLREHEGRIDRVIEREATVAVRWGNVLGHGLTTGDLGYPHFSSLAPPPDAHGEREILADALIAAFPPALLAPLLPGTDALAPLVDRSNETLEIVLWLDEAIDWSAAARVGLRSASITGLEGPFCLLADYRCGLWSDEELAAERPFGPDVPFSGSILESCGSMADLFACLDRDDALGWPVEVKEVVARLLFAREQFSEVDRTPWVHVDAGSAWRAKVTEGTWSEARRAEPESFGDWIVAARWLAWGWLRQLAQVKSLGERATRQLAAYAALLDPRGLPREALLSPPDALLARVRYVVMRNANRRNRFFNPGVGDWARRPVSGVPLPGTTRVYPAGDWTRNGLDVICMEGATLSGMRAARGVHAAVVGGGLPEGVPAMVPVLPPPSWYAGIDPLDRPGRPVGEERG